MFTDDQKKRIIASGVRIIGIVAVSNNNIIGDNGKLVIPNKEDMENFKSQTMGNPVIMGRKTYQSCKRPLYGRFSMVLTKDKDTMFTDAIVFRDLEDLTNQLVHLKVVYIAGGAEIYKLFDGLYHQIYLTRYYDNANGDTTFPINLETGDWATQLYRVISGGSIYIYHNFQKRR